MVYEFGNKIMFSVVRWMQDAGHKSRDILSFGGRNLAFMGGIFGRLNIDVGVEVVLFELLLRVFIGLDFSERTMAKMGGRHGRTRQN